MVKRNKYQKKYSRKKMPIFRLNVFLAAMCFVAIVAYLAILNNITVNGYRIKKVEDNLSKLKNENKNLSLGLSDKQSIEGVMAKVKDMDMVDAGSVTYLNMPSTVMVKK
jgi:hypothetical protein